jgi:hypothetical protein
LNGIVSELATQKSSQKSNTDQLSESRFHDCSSSVVKQTPMSCKHDCKPFSKGMFANVNY